MKEAFVFGKRNYLFMIAGLVLIAIGYILMAGGGSEDPTVFNEAIFNQRRLLWAPLFVLAGFAVELYAIMSKPE